MIDDIWSHDDVEPADGEYRSVLTIPIGEFGVFQGGSTAPVPSTRQTGNSRHCWSNTPA